MKTFKSAFLKNFGCKVNQSESVSIIKDLQDYLSFVDDINDSDVVIINSCAVTDRASQKILTFIRSVKRNFPEKKLVLIGCLSYLLKDKADNYNVDLIITNEEKEHLREILLSHSYISQRATTHNKNIQIFRTRAFLKIQDGCDNFCSYCIIPFLRGAPKSKPKDIILEELKNLISDGYKEIVLVGIHLGKYGLDLDTNLSDLLAMIEDIDGDFRIRLSSIEINELDANLINIIANSKKICPHLHIPLQSGSDKILKLMNRKYDSGKFISSISRLLRKIPDISIGFDVIVGFPGETESDFNDTIDVINKIKPHYLHVFPYSDRPYTKACNMSDKVDKATIKERVEQLKELGRQLKISAYKNKIGKKLRVLIEKDCIGYSDDYFKVIVSEGDINSFQYVFANKLDMDSKILIGTNEGHGVSEITEDKKEARTSNLLG